jgi:RimJ/RimL family protein N-acetyltransferase
VLRQFREDDFEAYLGIVSDSEVRRYLGGGDAPSREEAWRHMAMVAGIWTIRGYGPWAVALRTTGELLGRAGVWFPEGWPDIEVGWVIGREHWGFGYATEAGAEGLRQAFACLGVSHVTSLIHPEDVASRHVAEKLGGQVEKTDAFHGQGLLFYGYTAPPR